MGVCSLSVFFSLFFSQSYIGQLPRVSGEDPERIRVDSVVETSVCLSVCSLFDCQQIFSFFPLSSFSFYTVECSTVQLFHSFHRTHKTSLRVKKTIPESMPCIVAHSTRSYIGTAVGPLHPALHRNGA